MLNSSMEMFPASSSAICDGKCVWNTVPTISMHWSMTCEVEAVVSSVSLSGMYVSAWSVAWLAHQSGGLQSRIVSVPTQATCVQRAGMKG
jgi:hypothetical protein